MLVHPLYDVFFKDDSNILNYKIIKELKDSSNVKKRKQIAQIKKSLAIYGEQLLKYKDSPTTLFVLVKPSFLREASIISNNYKNVPPSYQFPLVEKMFSLYDQTIERFLTFGKTHLKERFQVSHFDPQYGDPNFLPSHVLNKFSPTIKISSFGEYYGRNEGCVHIWSGFITNHLFKRKIVVKEIKLLKNKSLILGSKYEAQKKGIYRNIISGSERRKLLGKHRKIRKKLR